MADIAEQPHLNGPLQVSKKSQLLNLRKLASFVLRLRRENFTKDSLQTSGVLQLNFKSHHDTIISLTAVASTKIN